MNLEALARAQRDRLRLGEHAGMTTARQAGAFLARAGVALRYGATPALPLASMYAAVARGPEPEQEAQRRAALITNTMIAAGTAIEVNIIAARVCIVHAALVPPLIALRRRGRDVDELELSDTARRVLAFVVDHPRATAGSVRAVLRVPPSTWPNVADDALGELQRSLVLDRGDTDVPKTGAPYLGKDGIPYRVVDDVHAAHVAAASALSIADAADQVIAAYVEGAVFAARRKLATMFAACLSAPELAASLERLIAAKRMAAAKLGGKDYVISATLTA